MFILVLDPAMNAFGLQKIQSVSELDDVGKMRLGWRSRKIFSFKNYSKGTAPAHEVCMYNNSSV
jgi:hypothetical protein